MSSGICHDLSRDMEEVAEVIITGGGIAGLAVAIAPTNPFGGMKRNGSSCPHSLI